MSNKTGFPLLLIGLLGAGLLTVASPARASGVEASRGANQVALFDMQGAQGRQCWARFSNGSVHPRNGVIEEKAFRVPCPEVMTRDFIATLQRALAARGQYDGPITGHVDQATRNAVHLFQRANGFNSPVLTLETAQRLGLVPADIAGR